MKKIKYILAILLLCLIIKWIYIPDAPDHIKEMVLENEEAYTSIAKLYYADYLENKSNVVSYYYDGDGKIYRDTYPEYRMELGEVDVKNCDVISDTYWDTIEKTWEGAYVYEGYVTFNNDARHKSLVYSVNGTRPQYVNAPDERNKNARCTKINDNWYYMELDYPFYEYVNFYLFLLVTEWKHITIIIILVVILLIKLYDSTIPKRMKELLQTNRNSYSILAEALYKDYQKNKDKCVAYYIEADNIQRYTSPSYEIKLNEEEEKAYQNVLGSYNDMSKSWDAIYIYKNYVLFRNASEEESLIYSIKNRRPIKIMIPDKKFAYCKKLTKQWYYFSSKRWE